jgi:cellulose synthase/poly-beta-1,6-N-acetylglucosamine synthase-like glycosyltransferase
MQWSGPVLSSLYHTVCTLLVVYGTYRIGLLLTYARARQRSQQPPPPPLEWPVVTVQLPLFNERFVARRLLQAVANLDYPKERLQIQVLDDSTDGTARLTRRLCTVLRRRGLDVVWLHRRRRSGFKAGALAAAHELARGDVIAIFDADFVPPSDFLRRSIPALMQPGVGIVQARWGHLNRDASWFTRMQAILLDGHFVIEQSAREAAGCFLSFNGTCGILRRETIDAAGGWTSDTVTEDLDLSIRAQLRGWRIVYLSDLVVPGEIPTDANSFRSQQRRWTKGGVQVARKLLPSILRSSLPVRVKLEAWFHLTCYGAYPLLLLLALLRTPARVFAQSSSFFGLLPGELELLALGTIPLVLFYFAAQRGAGGRASTREEPFLVAGKHGGREIQGPRPEPGQGQRQEKTLGPETWRTAVRSLPAMALGAGLSVSNTRAVLEGLFSRDLTFERTPKQGGQMHRLRGPGYVIPGTAMAMVEIVTVVYLCLWKVFGTGLGVLADVPLLLFFGFGLLSLAIPSLPYRVGRRRHVPSAIPHHAA